jgi:hypothetical protein
MPIFAGVLAEMGIRSSIGADSDGYPGILGYQGPSLTAVTDARVEPLGDAIEVGWRARARRDRADPAEHAGASTPTGCSSSSPSRARPRRGVARAGYEATLAMLEALGPEYAGRSARGTAPPPVPGPDRPPKRLGACGRPQHRLPGGRHARHRTAAPIWGYNASSSGHGRRHAQRGAAPAARARGRGPAGRLRRLPAGRDRADVDQRSRTTSRRTTSFRCGDSTRAMRSACATTRRRSSTSVITHRSSPGWCSR